MTTSPATTIILLSSAKPMEKRLGFSFLKKRMPKLSVNYSKLDSYSNIEAGITS
jgi:hypothetical protein